MVALLDIYVLFLHGKSEQFRMDYPGWSQPAEARQTVARIFVAREWRRAPLSRG